MILHQCPSIRLLTSNLNAASLHFSAYGENL